MPYTTVVTFTAGDALAAADLNSNFANLDYLNAKINAQIQIGAWAMYPRLTSGATPNQFETAGGRNYACMDYADGAIYTAEFGLVLPSDYDGGTMTAIFHWTANSTSTNGVVWKIAGVAIADDGALDVAPGTLVSVTDANKSSAYDLNISDATSAMTLDGTPAAGKYARFIVYRDPTDGADTLAATARLLSVVLTYTRS